MFLQTMSAVSQQPREKILKIAQQIPASAQVLAQLGQLLMDVNSGLEEIAILLKRDTALAARIIRISNSAAYGAGSRVGSIEEAVSRVGFAEVYRLTGIASAAQVFDHDLTLYTISGSLLRANTLVTALAVEALAKRVGIDSRAAYTSGLMRSAGKVVLDKLAKQTSPYIQTFAQSNQNHVLEWERGLFETTNADVAALILDSWHFPASVVSPVRDQYLTGKPSGSYARATHLLNIAVGIAVEFGYALPGEGNSWDLTPEKLKAENLTPELVTECGEEAHRMFEEIKDCVG
jgi:HD-like signal output (HDOD) protein